MGLRDLFRRGARGPVDGDQVEVRPPSEGFEEWAAVAETHVVVDEAWVDEMRPQLQAIALMNGGTYDGWEAAAD